MFKFEIHKINKDNNNKNINKNISNNKSKGTDLHDRAGISPVVAVVLLIMIALALGIALYAITGGYVGGSSAGGDVAIIVIENIWKAGNHLNMLLAYVRNDGLGTAVIDEAYILLSNNSVLNLNIGPYTINPGSVSEVIIPLPAKISGTFRIKLTGKGSSVSSGFINIGQLPVYPSIHEATITITELSGRDLYDYAVNVTLGPSWSGWRWVSNDGSDIFFVNKSGHPLYYWIENFDPVNKEATVWVKVPQIPGSSSVKIYMYYGWVNPYVTYRDPNSVFILFDNFESWDGWVNYSSGIITQSSGQAFDGMCSLKKDVYCDPNGGYKPLGITLSEPWALEALVKRTWYNPSQPCTWDRIGLIDDSGNGYGIGVYTGIAGGQALVWIDKRTNYRATLSTQVVLGRNIPYEWYFDQITWDGNGNLVAKVYDTSKVLLGTATYTDFSYTQFTRVYVFGGYTYHVDMLRVRPYTNPEPAVTVS